MTAPTRRWASLRGSSLAWDGAALLVIAAMAAWWCAPWAGPDHVFAQDDTWYVLLALEHFQDVLLSGQPWTGSPLGWPMADAVALADWVPAQAALTLPLRLAGAMPELEHVAAVVAGLCLTAFACHKAASALLGPGPHTWVAAAVGGFHPLHLSHVAHLNLVHHEPMVVGALLLAAGLAARRPALAACGAATSILGLHFGVYMGVHALFAAGVICVVAAVARAGDVRTWLAAVAGGALAALTVAPMVVVYSRFERAHDLSTPYNELTEYSWDLATTLQPMARVTTHRMLFGAPRVGDVTSTVANDPANPGYVAAALVLLGLVLVWRSPGPRWVWAAVLGVVAGAAVLALGPDVIFRGRPTGIPAPYRLLLDLPGWSGLRDPARWLSVSFTASSLLAAAGVEALGRRRRAVALLAGLVVVGLLAAERVLPDVSRRGAMNLHADYALLDTIEPGAVLDTGLGGLRRPACRCNPSKALRAAAFHGRPLAGGRYARYVRELLEFDAIARRWPSEQSAQALADAGVRVTFEHQPTEPVPEGLATCTETRLHRICVLNAQSPVDWSTAWPRSDRRVEDALQHQASTPSDEPSPKRRRGRPR